MIVYFCNVIYYRSIGFDVFCHALQIVCHYDIDQGRSQEFQRRGAVELIREFILGSNQVLQSIVGGEVRIERANHQIIDEGEVQTKDRSGEGLREPLLETF